MITQKLSQLPNKPTKTQWPEILADLSNYLKDYVLVLNSHTPGGWSIIMNHRQDDNRGVEICLLNFEEFSVREFQREPWRSATSNLQVRVSCLNILQEFMARQSEDETLIGIYSS